MSHVYFNTRTLEDYITAYGIWWRSAPEQHRKLALYFQECLGASKNPYTKTLHVKEPRRFRNTARAS